jgi:uncharacterized repeat protein (TIGR01451 family)
MARTGKWPARISLALSVAMVAALFSVINASGQQPSAAGLPTIGIDVQSATVTQATYSIVVRNQGTAASTNVIVRSAVPPNTTFESSDPAPSATTSPGTGAQSCNNQGVREPEGTTCQWDLGTIQAGETRTITAVYNLVQTNIATYRVTHQATVTDAENHSNSDTDDSLVRQRASINEDTWVNDAEPANTNHGTCNFLRVLQSNQATSYVDADTLLSPPAATSESTATLENFYGAQLRLEVLDTTYSPTSPGTIGAHRIVSGEWSQGSGTCPGGTGEGDQPRTGFEPTSASTPTSTTSIDASPDIANWDVTADLDTEADRSSFQGWELRDATATPGDNSTRFHSVESGGTATEQDPRVFLVYTTAESPTCLDADPEAATTTVGNEHVMRVFVTDGARIPAPGTTQASTQGPGGDACNGAPIAGTVVWEIQDDNPDIYFSSQEGQQIPKTITNNNATPNSIETQAEDGTTNAGVRLNAAPAAGADSTNVIEARLKGTSDPDPTPTGTPDPAQGTCSPTPVPPNKNCSGETALVDDVSVTWGQASGTSGTTTTTSASSTTAGSPSPSSSTSPSPTGSVSGSPSGSPSSPASASPTSASSPARSTRTISLFASANEVVYPGEVTLSGQITSSNQSCQDAGEFVRIQRRILGQSQYSDFDSENTDSQGRFDIALTASQSAEYVAVAPAHDNCADASSTSETVLVKVKITARSGRRSVERGTRVGIVGRVQPDHDGTTVLLQQRKGGRFRTIDRTDLNSRSRYRFVVDAGWTGRRVFRTLWRAQDDEHAANNSRNVVIRTTRR